VARKAYAKRYAQAVFEIALETKKLDKWQADLKKIVSTVEDAAFLAFLGSPKVHLDDKASLLSERLSGVNPLALNLVLLLVTRGKPGIIGGIAEEYQRLLNSHRGIESAEVITAVPLDDEVKGKLAKRLGAVVGKKVVLESEVNPALLGGIIAIIDGKLLDGSTRSKLLALKRELISPGR